MNSKIDPFGVACAIVGVFSLFMIGILFVSERQDQDNKAEIIKEAIQKGWTPEQVKSVLEKF
jgi:hypothetical protein